MTDERAWTKVSDGLPDEGMVVDTKIDDYDGCRHEQRLLHERNLWWFPDRSMYVYYTPTHWRRP